MTAVTFFAALFNGLAGGFFFFGIAEWLIARAKLKRDNGGYRLIRRAEVKFFITFVASSISCILTMVAIEEVSAFSVASRVAGLLIVMPIIFAMNDTVDFWPKLSDTQRLQLRRTREQEKIMDELMKEYPTEVL
jgi:hypothetical protein